MTEETHILVTRNDRLDNGLTETGKQQNESSDIARDVFKADNDDKIIKTIDDTGSLGYTDNAEGKKGLRNAMIYHWVQLCEKNFKEHKELSQCVKERGQIDEILRAKMDYWEDQLFIAHEKMCETEVEYKEAFGSCDQFNEIPTGYIRAVKTHEIQEWFSTRQFFISMEILDPKSKGKGMEDNSVLNIKASQSDITITQWEKQMSRLERAIDSKRRRDKEATDMRNLASELSLHKASPRTDTKDIHKSFPQERRAKHEPVEIDFMCKTFKILPAITESPARSPTPVSVSRSPIPALVSSGRAYALSPFPVLPKIPQIKDNKADDPNNVTRLPVVNLQLQLKHGNTKGTVRYNNQKGSDIRPKRQRNINDSGTGNAEKSTQFRTLQNIRPALMSIPEEVQDFRRVMKKTFQYSKTENVVDIINTDFGGSVCTDNATSGDVTASIRSLQSDLLHGSDIQNDQTKTIHLDSFQKTRIPVRRSGISLNKFLSTKLKLPPKEKYTNSKLPATKILVRKPNVYRHPCTVTPRTKHELLKGSNIPILTAKYIQRRRQIMLRKSKIPVPIKPKPRKAKSNILNIIQVEQHYSVSVSKKHEFIYNRETKCTSARKSTSIQTCNDAQYTQPVPPPKPVCSRNDQKPTSTHLRKKFFKVPAPM